MKIFNQFWFQFETETMDQRQFKTAENQKASVIN